jgi:hypothetical protein
MRLVHLVLAAIVVLVADSNGIAATANEISASDAPGAEERRGGGAELMFSHGYEPASLRRSATASPTG